MNVRRNIESVLSGEKSSTVSPLDRLVVPIAPLTCHLPVRLRLPSEPGAEVTKTQADLLSPAA